MHVWTQTKKKSCTNLLFGFAIKIDFEIEGEIESLHKSFLNKSDVKYIWYHLIKIKFVSKQKWQNQIFYYFPGDETAC